METVDNFTLIENNLVHIEFKLNRQEPSFFRVAKEAHHTFYRAMIEALRGSNNFFVTNKDNKVFRYKRGDEP
jgi:hypothetical protein